MNQKVEPVSGSMGVGAWFGSRPATAGLLVRTQLQNPTFSVNTEIAPLVRTHSFGPIEIDNSPLATFSSPSPVSNCHAKPLRPVLPPFQCVLFLTVMCNIPIIVGLLVSIGRNAAPVL